MGIDAMDFQTLECSAINKNDPMHKNGILRTNNGNANTKYINNATTAPIPATRMTPHSRAFSPKISVARWGSGA